MLQFLNKFDHILEERERERGGVWEGLEINRARLFYFLESTFPYSGLISPYDARYPSYIVRRINHT